TPYRCLNSAKIRRIRCFKPASSARRFEGLGIDNDNTELWKHRGFGTSWLPGGDGFLGECNP
ncbi:hypothetical protein ABMY39_15180, partial [Lacticaseibacillus paracasei]|uniref:hypothetical protein n=1 Tax=Lacticaseibacillus paracasei TaxID=1597 RepID=UPI0035665BE9